MLARGKIDEEVNALIHFAACAGEAFQLQDDVLGIIGNAELLGKPVGGDLREGKRTMIIIIAWQRADENDRSLLTRVLGNPQASIEDITRVTEMLRLLGAVDEVQHQADRTMAEALHSLDTLPASSEIKLLRELADRMVTRVK